MVIVGTPDGDKLLCYSCFNDRDEGELSYWLPEDPDNYPATCEQCGGVMIAPGEWQGPEDAG